MQAKGCSKNGTKQAAREPRPRPKPKPKQSKQNEEDNGESVEAGRVEGPGPLLGGCTLLGPASGIGLDTGSGHGAAAMPNQRTRRRDASAGPDEGFGQEEADAQGK